MPEKPRTAVLRELREELGIEARIERPLWVNQAFFTEQVSRKRYHELCFYYLIDFSKTDLLAQRFLRVSRGRKSAQAL